MNTQWEMADADDFRLYALEDQIAITTGGDAPALVALAGAEDAALIAAAPAMVEALKAAVLAWPESFDSGDAELNGGDLLEWFSEWRQQAKAALALAGCSGDAGGEWSGSPDIDDATGERVNARTGERGAT